jgi:AcrR family transcriptional regulator
MGTIATAPAPTRARMGLRPSASAPAAVAAAPTRRRLTDAALELFSRSGFHAVGLDRVLAAAGVSKQTFYNHFESRDALVLEVLRRRSADELDLLRRMLREFAGGDDPRAQLEALWDVLDAWGNRDGFRGCLFLTAASAFPNPHDPAHAVAADHVLALRRILVDLARAAGADDPESLGEHLLVLIGGALVVYHAAGMPHAVRLARRNAELLLERHLPPRGLTRTARMAD